MGDDPPGKGPAVGYADGGGVTGKRRLANHGKPWDGKATGLR